MWGSVMTWKDGMGEGVEASEGEDVYIIMADLYHYMAETQHCTN